MEWSWKKQDRAEDFLKRFGKGKYGRVLKMAKKPTPDAYKRTLQITSLGTVAIGGLGFVIYYIWANGPPFFRSLLGL